MKINATYLDVTMDETFELITEGGNDAGQVLTDSMQARCGQTFFLFRKTL